MNKKKKKNEEIRLSNLMEANEPESIFSEIEIIISNIIPEFDFNPLNRVFHDILIKSE